ncbi:hypothetical protein ASD76_11105 [Altererythrobacter sp. Root672]|nr:hypothetical protein ASD76_11105 [Altererythrobacter sp. Root672]
MLVSSRSAASKPLIAPLTLGLEPRSFTHEQIFGLRGSRGGQSSKTHGEASGDPTHGSRGRNRRPQALL